MQDITKQKLLVNASNAHLMASNWVMGAAGTLGTVWFALPEAQQRTIVEHLPVPIWVTPILLTVLGIVARLWPQNAITPTVAAASSETAPQPLDEAKK